MKIINFKDLNNFKFFKKTFKRKKESKIMSKKEFNLDDLESVSGGSGENTSNYSLTRYCVYGPENNFLKSFKDEEEAIKYAKENNGTIRIAS